MRKQLLWFLLLIFWFEPIVAQNDWVEVRNEQQIRVFIRDAPGYDVKELKIIAFFNVSASQFYGMLIDVTSQPNYLYSCMRTDLVQTKNKQEQVYYQQLKMPWPLKNRDGYFKQTSYKNRLEQTTVFETKAVGNLYELNHEYVRVPFLTATWKVKELSNNSISGEYQVLLDPGGQVPAWLVNLFIDRAPYETVLNMRKLLATGKYK